MNTIDDLRILQALPLDLKVRRTKQRIREWVNEFGIDGVYVSFSGGKDSTVLLDICRKMYGNDIKAVYFDTGLEYAEIRQFVRTFENVDIIRPKMRFDEVIKTYGYPFISKETSATLFYARKGSTWAIKRLNSEMSKHESFHERYKKYSVLQNTDFLIGDGCCSKMKKTPAKYYEKETEKVPILATMAEESDLRTKRWLQSGCNAFDSKNRKNSVPMSFWTQNDVLAYIATNHLPISSVYGDVVGDDDVFPLIPTECNLHTTGCSRTGCIYCGFGAHLEKGETRYQRLKRTHPRQYDYCMNGGAYDSDGLWKPTTDGLGMKHCIDQINELMGKELIRYE